MRWLVRCLYVVTEYKPLIEVVFASIVIWSLIKLMLARRSTVFTLRDWLGAAGLLAGTCSWALFAFFYVYLVVEHRIIFSGSVYSQLIYNIVGSSAAVTGVVLALMGRGWMRRSGLFVSLVMAFQWLGLWFIIDDGLDLWITIVSFVLLVAWGVISFATRYLAARSPTSSTQPQG